MTKQRISSFTVLAIGLVVVVIFAAITFSMTIVDFSNEYEAKVTFQSYDATNYEPTWGTPRTEMKGKTRAFIDPDGAVKKSSIGFIERGKVTGLQLELVPLAPINYLNGKYAKVGQNDEWRASEEWDLTIYDVEHKVSVYRLVGGLTISTATSRIEEGKNELVGIQMLDIGVLVELPQWEGTEDAKMGIGMIQVPSPGDVFGTPYDPPIETALVDSTQREFLMGLVETMDWYEKPYVSPWSPGVGLWGEKVSTGTSPIGAPNSVIIHFEWANIKPGEQDTGLLFQSERVEVTVAITFIVFFMAARPLYVPVQEAGAAVATGTPPDLPPSCGFFEEPVYDSAGKIQYCQQSTFLKSFLLLVVAIVLIAVAFILSKALLGWTGILGGLKR